MEQVTVIEVTKPLSYATGQGLSARLLCLEALTAAVRNHYSGHCAPSRHTGSAPVRADRRFRAEWGVRCGAVPRSALKAKRVAWYRRSFALYALETHRVPDLLKAMEQGRLAHPTIEGCANSLLISHFGRARLVLRPRVRIGNDSERWCVCAP
jgi:hypothetical protein